MIEGHDYSIHCNGPSGRSRMYAFLALITAFLAPLAQRGVTVFLRRYWGDDLDVDKAALFFGGFTALLLYGVMLNLFDGYIWRMSLGGRMFRLIGLTAPPDLNGEYRGTLEFQSVTDREAKFRGDFFMRISQTWEQISLIVQREAEAGGLVLIHSDMASIRIGMMAGVNTLRFVYTFEENLPRADGAGSMARQFSGAATFEFRRDGEAWEVTGHFFDDIGRSGQVSLRQELARTGPATVAPSPPTAA
jgi:SMODS-associating 2TM, beta-strand rich effector domain